jgi:hypothetical protein
MCCTHPHDTNAEAQGATYMSNLSTQWQAERPAIYWKEEREIEAL